jgi:hypothetical protein
MSLPPGDLTSVLALNKRLLTSALIDLRESAMEVDHVRAGLLTYCALLELLRDLGAYASMIDTIHLARFCRTGVEIAHCVMFEKFYNLMMSYHKCMSHGCTGQDRTSSQAA